MADLSINNVIDQIKKDYYWLAEFNLADSQLYDLHILIVRTSIGSDEMKDFMAKLKGILGVTDEKTVISVASKIFKYSFLPDEEDMGDLKSWIGIWHLTISADESEKYPMSQKNSKENIEPEPDEVKKTELSLNDKLSKYDWSKIVGIERRALLEELGVSLKDFVKWLGDKK